MENSITINIVEPGSPTPIDPVVPNTGLFTSGIGGAEAAIIVTISLVVILAIIGAFIYYKKKQGKTPSLFTRFKHTKSTTGLAVLALLVSIGTVAGLLKLGASAEEAESTALTVTAESEELTIELGDEPVFAVLPVELTVAEATEAGYTLTAYTEDTNLVSTTDSSKVIPMVTVDETELVALADNTYGLSLLEPDSETDEVYTALSTDQSNPTIIKSMPEYTPTEENDTTTIYYGFYITPDTPYGTYAGSDIYYNATINTTLVTFNSNGLYFNNDEQQTTNEVEYITVPQEESEGTINQIISGEYLEPAQSLPYIFLGWSTNPEATTPTYISAEDLSQNLPILPNQSIILYAIWQKATTITFDANDGTGDKTTQTIIAGESDNLNPNEFTREGYTFTGWNTDPEGEGRAYADEAEYTADSGQSKNVTLYAQWEEDLPIISDLTEMQDFAKLSAEEKASVLASMDPGQQYQLKDNRDQTMYYIAKLADGNVWMTQNLDLDLNENTTFTPADTDISQNWAPMRGTISFTGTTVGGWEMDGNTPYSADPGDAYSYTSNSNTVDTYYSSLTECEAAGHTDCLHYRVGNYYNWSAAIASNDSSIMDEQYENASSSICPAGWRLPVGPNAEGNYYGDMLKMIDSYDGILEENHAATSNYLEGGFNAMRTNPLWLVRANRIHYGDLGGYDGAIGYYWSSTVNDSGNVYRLRFDFGSVETSSDDRRTGQSLRCVVR